jgi:hypothetical protein
MTPQDNPGYVLVSRELAELAADWLDHGGNPTPANQLRAALPGYSFDVVKAAFTVGNAMGKNGQDGELVLDRWLTEHLKGGST